MKPNPAKKIFVTRQLPGTALDRLRAVCEVNVWPEPLPPPAETLKREVAGCHGLLSLLSDCVDGTVMDAAGPQLQVISNYAVGYNNVDVAEASRRGIRVGNTPDVLTDATADIAVSLLFAASRRLAEASAQVHDGEWKTWEPDGLLGMEPAGRTLGVIGMGRIGRAFAERMVGGWSMKLLYTSRRDQPEVDEQLEGRRVELDELLRESDFVSVHVALSDTTRHLIDTKALDAMKSTAVLINTARGEVIDQDALVEALSTGKIFAAGLDVTTPEPLAADHPLIRLPNAIVLPHIGSATIPSRHAMAEIAVDNLLAGLQGEPLRCEVS